MNPSNTPPPVLPSILRLPLKLIPGRVRYGTITKTLNTLFADALAEGELDFVADKTVNISIDDAELAFSIRYAEGRLQADKPATRPDILISGNTYAFLLLGTRKEDADTLFFRQQLNSQGDTELGLFIKNFLDGLDLDSLPAHATIDSLMHKALWLADKTRYAR